MFQTFNANRGCPGGRAVDPGATKITWLTQVGAQGIWQLTPGQHNITKIYHVR